MALLGLPLAALIGLSLGLLGGGGSILAVPVLVYVAGFDPKQGIAMGLAVVGVTSLAGAVGHARRGNVSFRAAAIFGGVAMVGTFGGAKLAAFMSGGVQLALFGATMLVAAVAMLRSGRRARAAKIPEAPRPPASFPILAAAALGVGVLTGVAGVGGGFLVVPALALLAGLPMHRAVGTSLAVIAFNSLTGFVGYLGQVDVPWAYLGAFVSIAVGGSVAGAWLSRFFSQAALKSSFSALLLVMGALVLVANRDVLLGAVQTAHAAEPASR